MGLHLSGSSVAALNNAYARPYQYDAREFDTDPTHPLFPSDGSPGDIAPIYTRMVASLGTFTRPRTLVIPAGTFVANQTAAPGGIPVAIQCASKISVMGQGVGKTTVLSDAGSTPFYAPAGSSLFDIEFGNFTIDCSAQTNATYTALMKAMFLQDVTRFSVHDMMLKGSWGTALGCDYLVDYLIDNVYILNPGRGIVEKSVDPASTSGGSGIGIGTGRYAFETGVVSNVIVEGAGRVGLFYETQPGATYPQSRGAVARGVITKGCWAGLQDAGVDGLDADITALNCTYGVVMTGTSLTANAGVRFNIKAKVEGSTTADVLLGNIPDGGGTIRISSGSGVAGVTQQSGTSIGKRLTLVADPIDNHTGAVASLTQTAMITDLAITGRARANGDGVKVDAPLDGFTFDLAVTRGLTGAVGLRTLGSGRSMSNSDLRGDVRNNPGGGWVNEQTVPTDSRQSILGADTTQVSNLRVTSIAPTQVALAWNEPIPNTGITSYSVQYRTKDIGSGAGAWTTFTHTSSTATSITVTGLTNDTYYDFQVGKDVSGTIGTYAGPVSATVRADDLYVIDPSVMADQSLNGVSTNAGTGAAKTITVLDSGTGGVLGVASNMVKATAGTSTIVGYIDTATSDGSMALTLDRVNVPNAAFLGPALCVSSAATYLAAPTRVSATDQHYCIQKKLSGATTVLVASTVVPQAGDVVRFVKNGAVLKLVVNGAVVATYTLAGSDLTTFGSLTKHGLIANYTVDVVSRASRVAWSANKNYV